MDIDSLLNTPTRVDATDNSTTNTLPSNSSSFPLQSSPADVHEVSEQLLHDDHDESMETEPTTTDPSEREYSIPAESPEPSVITAGTSEGADEGSDGEREEGKDGDAEMGSEISVGEDLQDDLEEALDDQNFTFNGSFYHASLLTTAPNPCIEVSELGLIGLPLSERDAQAIISSAKLAPFGHGERTVVDKTVRNTWQIEPAKVAFTNPHWEPYLNSTVVHEVCKTLGITIGSHPPKLELYKLLLYEQGSHFLPHQDTQKVKGMFATVIIILPSPYSGGEVVVSHGSTTKTIDLAPSSLLSTAVLAWYTDVKHEVKEVTKGYRLALSYNLIHQASSSSIPQASGPSTDDLVAPLRRILSRWKAGKYQDDVDRNLIAYLLNHEYSGVDLKAGFNALKGIDAQRVSFLRPIAEELGFKIGLATLEHNVKGDAEDYGDGYYRRGRYDEDVGSSGVPGMLEVTDSTTKISGLVDLDGKHFLPGGDIIVGEEELIPKEPFEGKEPDDEDYEGFTGNEAGQLEYWYHRTVLVLMPEEKVDDVCYSVKGIPYALQKLKDSKSIPPTATDRQWASRLIKNDGHRLTKDHIITLLNYAMKWNDLQTWMDILKLRTCSLQVVGSDLFIKGWELFSFEQVRVGFEELLARSTQLKERMDFIYTVQSTASPEDRQLVLSWCKKETEKVLLSYTSATPADVPAVKNVIRMAGLQSFRTIVMSNLLKKIDNFDFWIAFMKSLGENCEAIQQEEAKRVQHPQPETVTAESSVNPLDAQSGEGQKTPSADHINALIEESLRAAALRWAQIPSLSGFNPYLRGRNLDKEIKIERFIQITEAALTVPDLDVCRDIFADLIKLPGEMVDKFEDLYIPLIPRLHSLLEKKKQAITSPPFVNLFQALIALYLKEILVDQTHKYPRLRKLGCGCQDCNLLDAFILDPKTSTTMFRFAQSRRSHLEYKLLEASDLCSFTTIRTGSPHGLQITKHTKIVQASTWEGRRKAAKAFLASIGSENVISQIMGARYLEVRRAIEGIARFGSEMDIPGTVLPAGGAGPSRAHQPTDVSNSGTRPAVPKPLTAGPVNQSQIVGKKRKNVVQLGPVIDLTEDD